MTRKTYSSSELLTAAYIAIGAARAIDKLTETQRIRLWDQFGGEIGVINDAISSASIIEFVYKNVLQTERDNFGTWDYEVSESFGYQFIVRHTQCNAMTTVAPWDILAPILVPEMSEARISALRIIYYNTKR